MTALTYPLLLKLHLGKGGVVEQLTLEEREALHVETPLTRYLKEAARRAYPRHIFLTGNAGDGKTFAGLMADETVFTVVRDASAGREGASERPIPDLAARLTQALTASRRLLVAINRGQLERLEEYARSRPGPLETLLSQVRDQWRMREQWPDSADQQPEVAVIDLGLLDTVSEQVLFPVFDKVCSASRDGPLSPQSRLAFEAALEALASQEVRRNILWVLQAVRAQGHHVTMRQLWSLVAYLATGHRPAEQEDPVSLEDAVGARLFSEQAEGLLFYLTRIVQDPLMWPEPEIAREVLLGTISNRLRQLPGLQGLLRQTSALEGRGRTIIRVAMIHGAHSREIRQHRSRDEFRQMVEILQRPGAESREARKVAIRLLNGVYRALGRWSTSTSFPAWQTLCYDSERLINAASVSTSEVDVDRLVIKLPRPSPACEQALSGAWLPPYLWLALAGTQSHQGMLRVTPRLFRALREQAADEFSAADVNQSDIVTLQWWLARLDRREDPAQSVRVHRDGVRNPLTLDEDPLAGQTTVGWE